MYYNQLWLFKVKYTHDDSTELSAKSISLILTISPPFSLSLLSDTEIWTCGTCFLNEFPIVGGLGVNFGDEDTTTSALPEERLYLSLLEAARRHGIAVDPTHTANERARDIARALPGVPVDAITAAYVRARFGGVSQGGARLDALRQALREAAPGTG